ncbi:MAG: DUF2628 domain-containing protein [Pseudomonadota bacterium]
MAVWNVLTKDRADETEVARAERVVFVNERPFVLAFLFTLFALVRFRLWLALVAYLIVSAALTAVCDWLKVIPVVQVVAHLGFNLLVTLELSALRIWKLRRIGYREAGVVAAPSREEAERRFFAQESSRLDTTAARPVPARPAAPSTGAARAPMGVIGSFPEPRIS